MKILELSVENFGVFSGRHTFDLNVDSNKPLIIFGGLNGAGKTTLFDSIKLCLYGINFQGEPLSKKQYESYLQRKVHRKAGLIASEHMSVELAFEHSHLGETTRYYVKRSWNASNLENAILQIIQDGAPVTDITQEQLQDFLLELIPIGLSKLFFFDGEQIQKLANDDRHNSNLIEAFNALLGLTAIEELRIDLKIYRSRKKKVADSNFELEYVKLKKERESLVSEYNLIVQNKAQKQTEIDAVNSEIERKKHELASKGGGYAAIRDDLEARRMDLRGEIAKLESEIRELAADVFPFSILPSLCIRLKDRLHTEEEYQKKIAASEMLYSFLSEARGKFDSPEFWAKMVDVNKKTSQMMSEKIELTLKSLFKPVEVKNTFVHQLSPPDKSHVLGWIDKSLNWVPGQLKSLVLALEERIRELRDIEQSMERVPENDVVGDIILNLNVLHQELGKLATELGLRAKQAGDYERQIEDKTREMEKKFAEETQLKREQESLALSSKVGDALETFAHTLRKNKIVEVSEAFVEAFNDISTKKNRITHANIDSTNFTITLFRHNGIELSKDELSAGEKQIYAMAMLFALARVSGRPLPFIIDTPLARLDSEHRANLVSRFFVKASHQAIIFSTNTEIDQRYYDQLELFASRSYLLRYDANKDSSIVSVGYFWPTTGRSVIRH